MKNEMQTIPSVPEAAKALLVARKGYQDNTVSFEELVSAWAILEVAVAQTVASCDQRTPHSNLQKTVPLTYEQQHAITEGHQIHASDEYFAARSHLLDTKVNRNCFEAGFKAAVRQGSELAKAVAQAEQFRKVLEQIAPRVDAQGTERLRAALAELVACKDLKAKRQEAYRSYVASACPVSGELDRLTAEYMRRMPAARAAARAALSAEGGEG